MAAPTAPPMAAPVLPLPSVVTAPPTAPPAAPPTMAPVFPPTLLPMAAPAAAPTPPPTAVVRSSARTVEAIRARPAAARIILASSFFDMSSLLCLRLIGPPAAALGMQRMMPHLLQYRSEHRHGAGLRHARRGSWRGALRSRTALALPAPA